MNSLYWIGLRFRGSKKPLLGEYITARGLHGVLYTVLKQYDARGAAWLHAHAAPKPYNLTPYYDNTTAVLSGMRLGALTAQTAELLYASWHNVQQSGQELHLGPQPFFVQEVTLVPGVSFETLASSAPNTQVTLRFLSPTTFKQGPGHLPLPLPVNIFSGPFKVWNAYAPTPLRIPGDWLEWCRQDVFVTAHNIETAVVTISQRQPPFIGFVGEVQFEARSNALLYLSLFQGLAGLAAYSGVGYKTTMGMGAVERL